MATAFAFLLRRPVSRFGVTALAVVVGVTLFVGNSTKVQGLDKVFRKESNHERLSTSSLEPLDETPMLVRCTWSGSTVQNQTEPPSLPFASCPKDVCAHQKSHEAYGNFLFHQAVSGERKRGDEDFHNKMLHHFVEDPAQCLFLTTNWQDMCHCRYDTFVDYCHHTFYSNEFNVKLIGDSTAHRLRSNIDSVCQNNVVPPPQDSTLSGVKGRTTNVVVVNDSTLHRLYLPFYRETDVPTKTGHDRLLHTPPTSIPDFWRQLDERL